jgi:hypothetical protein
MLFETNRQACFQPSFHGHVSVLRLPTAHLECQIALSELLFFTPSDWQNKNPGVMSGGKMTPLFASTECGWLSKHFNSFNWTIFLPWKVIDGTNKPAAEEIGD